MEAVCSWIREQRLPRTALELYAELRDQGVEVSDVCQAELLQAISDILPPQSQLSEGGNHDDENGSEGRSATLTLDELVQRAAEFQAKSSPPPLSEHEQQALSRQQPNNLTSAGPRSEEQQPNNSESQSNVIRELNLQLRQLDAELEQSKKALLMVSQRLSSTLPSLATAVDQRGLELLVPLFVAGIEHHPVSSKRMDLLRHLLEGDTFRKPCPEERQIIVTAMQEAVMGSLPLAQLEQEVLPGVWALAPHRYPEKRTLAMELIEVFVPKLSIDTLHAAVERVCLPAIDDTSGSVKRAAAKALVTLFAQPAFLMSQLSVANDQQLLIHSPLAQRVVESLIALHLDPKPAVVNCGRIEIVRLFSSAALILSQTENVLRAPDDTRASSTPFSPLFPASKSTVLGLLIRWFVPPVVLSMHHLVSGFAQSSADLAAAAARTTSAADGAELPPSPSVQLRTALRTLATILASLSTFAKVFLNETPCSASVEDSDQAWGAYGLQFLRFVMDPLFLLLDQLFLLPTKRETKNVSTAPPTAPQDANAPQQQQQAPSALRETIDDGLSGDDVSAIVVQCCSSVSAFMDTTQRQLAVDLRRLFVSKINSSSFASSQRHGYVLGMVTLLSSLSGTSSTQPHSSQGSARTTGGSGPSRSSVGGKVLQSPTAVTPPRQLSPQLPPQSEMGSPYVVSLFHRSTPTKDALVEYLQQDISESSSNAPRQSNVDTFWMTGESDVELLGTALVRVSNFFSDPTLLPQQGASATDPSSPLRIASHTNSAQVTAPPAPRWYCGVLLPEALALCLGSGEKAIRGVVLRHVTAIVSSSIGRPCELSINRVFIPLLWSLLDDAEQEIQSQALRSAIDLSIVMTPSSPQQDKLLRMIFSFVHPHGMRSTLMVELMKLWVLQMKAFPSETREQYILPQAGCVLSDVVRLLDDVTKHGTAQHRTAAVGGAVRKQEVSVSVVVRAALEVLQAALNPDVASLSPVQFQKQIATPASLLCKTVHKHWKTRSSAASAVATWIVAPNANGAELDALAESLKKDLELFEQGLKPKGNQGGFFTKLKNIVQ